MSNLSEIIGRHNAHISRAYTSYHRDLEAVVRSAVSEAYQAGREAGLEEGIRSALSMQDAEWQSSFNKNPDTSEAKASRTLMNKVKDRMKSRHGLNTK